MCVFDRNHSGEVNIRPEVVIHHLSAGDEGGESTDRFDDDKLTKSASVFLSQ